MFVVNRPFLELFEGVEVYSLTLGGGEAGYDGGGTGGLSGGVATPPKKPS